MYNRRETFENLIKQQEIVIQSLKNNEQLLRNELTENKKTIFKLSNKEITDEQIILESNQKNNLSEITFTAAKRRNMELQARCDELGKKLEAERKKR